MKIAIFGGSFDPPHIGHEQIAQLILNQLPIDLLFVIPTFLSPFKNKSFLDSKQRFELVKKLFCGEERVVVSDYEVLQGYSVPSIKTVKHLYEIYDLEKVYFIIGDDHLENLHKWESFEELNTLVEFVVINRHNIKTKYKNFAFSLDVSSSKIRQTLDMSHIPKKIQNEVKELWKKEYKI